MHTVCMYIIKKGLAHQVLIYTGHIGMLELESARCMFLASWEGIVDS